MEPTEKDNSVPVAIVALLSNERLILRETQRAVTPFGGVVVFVAYLQKIDLAIENRIAELKHDLGADHFCLKQFHATEAAFRSVLLLFNLLAEFQRAAGLPGYREPATIRTQILTCGAILGRSARRLVLHMGASWGGLQTRNPLLANILRWQIPTSPKLHPTLRC